MSKYVGFIWIYFLEHSPLNDTTIEERVTILEFQVANLTVDVTDLELGVTDLGIEVTDLELEIIDLGDEIDVIDGEVAVIFADQVIQDERILELEDETEGDEAKCLNQTEEPSHHISQLIFPLPSYFHIFSNYFLC